MPLANSRLEGSESNSYPTVKKTNKSRFSNLNLTVNKIARLGSKQVKSRAAESKDFERSSVLDDLENEHIARR